MTHALDPVTPLPPQPPDARWPSTGSNGSDWPLAEPGPEVDRRKLGSLLDSMAEPESELGESHALLVVQRGAIVAERYRESLQPTDTLKGWSLSKVVLHGLLGCLVRDGRLDVTAPADVPEWSDPADPRHGITVDQLMRMSSGLAFIEDYVEGKRSDVQTMLWGEGQHDMGAYAASRPLAAPPDTTFHYNSGTSMILARLVGQIVGGGQQGYEAFVQRELTAPLGMSSFKTRYDGAGIFVGSSAIFATARDFARLGLFCLRDGCWEGRRLLPDGWIDYGRTPTPTATRGEYGATFWLYKRPLPAFAAHGFEGQRIVVVPELDLVVVRLGATRPRGERALKRFIADVISCFDPGDERRASPSTPSSDPASSLAS